jgi:hypothetical protein
MKYLFLSFAMMIVSMFVQLTHAQKKSKKDEAELFYLFKKDWSSAPDFASAAYFMQVVKDNDSSYICRYYNKTGPMVKQESFRDEQLSIPNGLFCWYNNDGNLDSIGSVKNGYRDDYWTFYRDNKRYLSLKYKDAKIVEKENYAADIYVDSSGAQSGLKEKLMRDSVTRDSLMKARDSTHPVQVEAKFKRNWNSYIESNLKTPDRLQNILGPGKYVVIVSFTIDKEGNVADVFLVKSCEWSADAEVTRVIKGSPLWIPAQQNGKPVIYRQRQALTFAVSQY